MSKNRNRHSSKRRTEVKHALALLPLLAIENQRQLDIRIAREMKAEKVIKSEIDAIKNKWLLCEPHLPEHLRNQLVAESKPLVNINGQDYY